jgi:hypothetical protein
MMLAIGQFDRLDLGYNCIYLRAEAEGSQPIYRLI